MRIGIVGHEAAKFTRMTELQAKTAIRDLLDQHDPEVVISGGCHLGGIDIWAIEEAKHQNRKFIEHIPKNRMWSGPDGYMARNMAIASGSDLVCSIVVAELPPEYTGMRFKICYHCNAKTHVKSGGCWTVKQAIKLGKLGQVIEI